jgi:DNA-binding NtrC family response regulator
MTFYGSLSGDRRSADPGSSYRDAAATEDTPELVGDSMPMQRLRLQIERIGPHFRTVLVRGEIGTGKELVARALHAKSDRAAMPLSVIHAGRVGGGERNVDRGLTTSGQAAQDRILFLDRIDEMSPAAQKDLLEMLDQRSGLKMIAATSQDLRVMAAAGLFRSDLYHRLAMVEIPLEPLRRRTDDIPAIADYFVRRFASRYQRSIRTIAPDAMPLLLEHEWPGNVRELENVVHNAVLQCEGTAVATHDLAALVKNTETVLAIEEMRYREPPMRLQEVVDRHVLRVLRECSGNKVKAAEVLGISRSTLYRMLEGCTAGSMPQERS